MAEGTVERRCVLVVVDRRLQAADWEAIAARVGGGRPVFVLPLAPGVRSDEVPSGERGVSGAQWLRVDELLDRDRFHQAVLALLNEWPATRLPDGRTVDDALRLTTGHSLWWTGPAAARHPIAGPVVPFLRTLWLAREAQQRLAPELVLYGVGDSRTATILGDLRREDCPVERLPGSASVRGRAGELSRIVWAVGATLTLLMLPVWFVLRSLFARLVTRSSVPATPGGAGQAASEERPVLILSGWYPDHVREEEGTPRVWYWDELAGAVREHLPGVSVRYLLHTTTFRMTGWKRWLRPFQTGWGRLRRLPEALPISQCHPGLRSYLAAVPHQLRLMVLWWRCERSATFRASLRFAGVEVSCLFIPLWRRAIAGVAKWARDVEGVTESLRAAGNPGGVLVHEEFYRKGMLTIAAAQRLGLPTIGVQHGTIGPDHMMYIVPAGQLTGAPTPDLFAAYGSFAAEILSVSGQFPRERIRIVGAPRFDHLLEQPASSRGARERLGWPDDQQVVLLTSEGFRLSEAVVRSLLSIAGGLPGWRFVIKVHPHDRQPDAYAALLREAKTGNVDIVHSHGRLADLLAGCDVLLSGASTTVLEALLMGKAVVCANPGTEADRYPYVAAGVARGARSTEELRSALHQALRGPRDESRRRSFLQRHLGPTAEGRGREAFVALLREMLPGERSACREPGYCPEGVSLGESSASARRASSRVS